jgi:cobalt-zinc-cadmium efflux system protein
MGAGHQHGHSRGADGARRLRFALLLTGAILVVEVVFGWLSGSLALLADAGHMLTDAAGLFLALVAIHLAERPATPARTYGYYRVEILAATLNSAVLTGVSILILWEGWQRLRQPPPVATDMMLAVGVVGLVANLVAARVLHPAAEHSLNLRGAYLEVVFDALASLGVIVAALVMKTTGWPYADALVSIVIGLAILPRTWGLLKEALGVLLEGVPDDVNLAALRDRISQVPGVAEVHDLHVWTITSGMHAMSVHTCSARMPRTRPVLDDVQRCVTSEFRIAHVTVQVESRICAGETHL